MQWSQWKGRLSKATVSPVDTPCIRDRQDQAVHLVCQGLANLACALPWATEAQPPDPPTCLGKSIAFSPLLSLQPRGCSSSRAFHIIFLLASASARPKQLPSLFPSICWSLRERRRPSWQTFLRQAGKYCLNLGLPSQNENKLFLCE